MIRRYTINDRRTLLTAWRAPTTLPDGTRVPESTAVFDHPTLTRVEAARRFDAGAPTPGYEVSVEVLGEGTTVETWTETVSRGWDDHDVVRYATLRNDAGAWVKVFVRVVDSGYAVDDPTVFTLDATPEARAEWEAWKRADEEARARAAEARAERDAVRRGRVARATVVRGAFVRVARGRKVTPGLVGRVFYLSAGAYGTRAGIATSTRTERRERNGRIYEAAVHEAWCAVDNLDVLLAETPSDPRELAALYRYAPAVAAHAAARVERGRAAAVEAAGERGRTLVDDYDSEPMVDAFSELWRWAWEAPHRLTIMAAWGPTELPAIDADTPRTLEDVCAAVDCGGDDGTAHTLALWVLEGRGCVRAAADGEPDAPGAPGVDERVAAVEREDIRRLALELIGPVYVPEAQPKRARRARSKAAA